ncbi:DUF4268 domain-containing protein [Mesorhizobium sp. LNJC403B00]|uniref:DUF4268 domain-containing protein n=1 Tax=Mesorhizobium sp. LNJC403B00 TaxID=1287280 RepID=UPI0003CDDCC5|nr:DUF4268 domain-containing protein [Mesorhizobium sp. LNJC403B00]ESX96701.1 hypothetical protein X754_03870 [Mesorhizobium sp. LNJC403B00]
MSFPKLGRLTTISAKAVWLHEAQTFTPWLAENLDLLGEALQIGDLELKATELPAGEFRLDILAEDESGNPVLIENQFGNTDHRHLGQLITYIASQRSDATAIWIAESIREDHRAAIDWLNSTTKEGFNFFAVEVEALKIGDSDPAPFFRVVAQPNNWVRAVDAKVSSDGELAARHKIRLAYWASFAEYLRKNDPSFAIKRQNKDHWFEFRIGRRGFAISCTISTTKSRIGVELYNHNDPLKIGIRQLALQRQAIETEIGEPLDWQELPTKKASRIALYKDGVDPANSGSYDALHAWMLDKMQRFRLAFTPRVKLLDLGGDGVGGEPDEDI